MFLMVYEYKYFLVINWYMSAYIVVGVHVVTFYDAGTLVLDII